MKKTLICMLTVMTFLFLSCQNTADPAAEKPNSETTPSAATPAGEGGGSGTGTGGGSGQSPISIGGDGTVTIISRNLVSLGETTETLNSVSYTVKKYADVYVESPYFYTYYKLYYSNNKLRRVFTYYHDLQCEMDYKYDEFVDHVCKKRRYGDRKIIREISTYYENGKLESYFYDFFDGGLHGSEYGYDINGREIYSKSFDNNVLSSETIKEYDSNSRLTSEKTYNNNVLTYETKYTYWDNGQKKTVKNYGTNNIINSEYEYYETGIQKSQKFYQSGVITSESIYYENGKQKISKNYQYGNLITETEYYVNGSQKSSKSYSNNVLYSETLYYQGTGPGLGTMKGSVQYSNTGDIVTFTFKFSSGYTHYYYSNGYFYTFENNQYITPPANLNDHPSKTYYGQTQASAKLEELRNQD